MLCCVQRGFVGAQDEDGGTGRRGALVGGGQTRAGKALDPRRCSPRSGHRGSSQETPLAGLVEDLRWGLRFTELGRGPLGRGPLEGKLLTLR